MLGLLFCVRLLDEVGEQLGEDREPVLGFEHRLGHLMQHHVFGVLQH